MKEEKTMDNLEEILSEIDEISEFQGIFGFCPIPFDDAVPTTE